MLRHIWIGCLLVMSIHWGCRTLSGSFAGRTERNYMTEYVNEKMNLRVMYYGDYKLKTAKIKDNDLNLPFAVLDPLRQQLKSRTTYALLAGYTQPISPYYATYGFIYPGQATQISMWAGKTAADMACLVKDVYVFAEDSLGTAIRMEYEPLNEGIYIVEYWMPHNDNLLRLLWVANYKKSFTADDFPFTPAPTKEQKVEALRKEAIGIVNSIKK